MAHHRRPQASKRDAPCAADSFASTAEDVGLPLPTIAALLGHSASSSTTLGYIHKVDTALISAANRVAEKLAASMKGEAKDENAALVQSGYPSAEGRLAKAGRAAIVR